jgi:hypothetical protein
MVIKPTSKVLLIVQISGEVKTGKNGIILA